MYRLSVYIVTHKTPTIMKEFLAKNKKVLIFLFLLLIVFLFMLKGAKMMQNRSIIIGQPDNIVLISPEESQDVIVIGDPEKVQVKPKNKK